MIRWMKITHLTVTVVVAVKIVIVKKYGVFVILFVRKHWTSLRSAISYWKKDEKKRFYSCKRIKTSNNVTFRLYWLWFGFGYDHMAE